MTSFLTIGGIRVGHHGIFRRLQCEQLGHATRPAAVDGRLVPAFPTKLLAEPIHETDPSALPSSSTARRCWWSLLISALWGVVTRDRDLLEPEVSKREINAILLDSDAESRLYVGVIVLAIFAPKMAAFGYLVITIAAVLRARGDRARPTEIAGPA